MNLDWNEICSQDYPEKECVVSGKDGGRDVLEEILQEIEYMVYPAVGIGCGLEDAGITDRYEAAAYGFQEAREKIAEIIRSHNDDGWTYCGDGENMPSGPFGCIVTVTDTDTVTMEDFENILPYCVGYDGGQWNDENGEEVPFDVIAWRPMPEPYRPQKSDGGDYRQQIMESFLKVE